MKWFRKRPRARSAGEYFLPDENTPPNAWDGLVWLEADQTPLGVRALDCRPTALGMIGVTRSKSVARKFAELRESSGEDHRGCEPADSVAAACDLRYAHNGAEVPNGCLFSSECMEEKWDGFLFGDYVYLRRSWTGELVYKVRTVIRPAEVIVSRVAARADACAQSADLAIRQVDYLLRSHAMHMPVAHPLPETMASEVRGIALYSFSVYGAHGLFASYEDTTRSQPWYFGDDEPMSNA